MNPKKDIILYNIEKEIVWEQSINFTHEISEPFSNNRTESKLRDLNNTSYYTINKYAYRRKYISFGNRIVVLIFIVSLINNMLVYLNKDCSFSNFDYKICIFKMYTN